MFCKEALLLRFVVWIKLLLTKWQSKFSRIIFGTKKVKSRTSLCNITQAKMDITCVKETPANASPQMSFHMVFPLFVSLLIRAAAAAVAKSLQSCLTLCDPIDAAHQAPPSLGLSRQEHWSGLPFPSPMHESEK